MTTELFGVDRWSFSFSITHHLPARPTTTRVCMYVCMHVVFSFLLVYPTTANKRLALTIPCQSRSDRGLFAGFVPNWPPLTTFSRRYSLTDYLGNYCLHLGPKFAGGDGCETPPSNKTFGGSVDKVIVYSAPTCVVGFLFHSLTRPFNCTVATVDPLCVSYHPPRSWMHPGSSVLRSLPVG